jgi:hypothetical protein
MHSACGRERFSVSKPLVISADAVRFCASHSKRPDFSITERVCFKYIFERVGVFRVEELSEFVKRFLECRPKVVIVESMEAVSGQIGSLLGQVSPDMNARELFCSQAPSGHSSPETAF